MGEVPSWPEDSLSHSGHFLVPSPAGLGLREVSEWHHVGQSGALLICLASITYPNIFKRTGWRRTSHQHIHHCNFNRHLAFI